MYFSGWPVTSGFGTVAVDVALVLAVSIRDVSTRESEDRR